MNIINQIKKKIRIIIFYFLLGCSNSVNSNSDLISSKAIIFFSSEEQKIYSQEDQELLSDFRYYSQKFSGGFEDPNIQIIYSNDSIYKFLLDDGSFFEIQIEYSKNIVGVIFFNSKSNPKVFYGVFSDLDLKELFDSEFS